MHSNIEDLIKSQKILHLATNSLDNEPHVVPVWYMYKDGKIYIGSNINTRKIQNILARKKVSFCIDRGVRSPIKGTMGLGIAKIILDEESFLPIAKEILLRYFQTLKHRSAKELLLNTNCVIEITITKTVSWKY